MNPNAVVVAAGCYVQAQGVKADDCIDIIIGKNKKKDLIAILDEHFAKIEEKEPQVELIDIAHTHWTPVCAPLQARPPSYGCAPALWHTE